MITPLRSGARDLIQQAVEAELSALLEAHAADRTDDGRARLVRHGHLPERRMSVNGSGENPDGSISVVMLGFVMWHIHFSSRIDGVFNTAMICRPSGAITNFQLYLSKRRNGIPSSIRM